MLYEIYCDKFTTKKMVSSFLVDAFDYMRALILYWATRQHRTL